MAIPLMVAGAVMQGYSAYQSGKDAQAAFKKQSEMAQDNAAAVKEQTVDDARRQDISARKQIGDMRANFGAAGVSIDGSALDVLGESATNAAMDQMWIKHSGEVQARRYVQQGDLDLMQGNAAARQGTLGGSAAVLSGVADVYKYQASRQGYQRQNGLTRTG